mmetsp:Transcript_17260/g.60291  ORF Transcript_17260/g.60291 Transcript_17260/m.60291 type:complete len:140 (-) Transcript_17260:35-454(-)
MREQGCGHNNMETPRVLSRKGVGKIIVDVGLGDDAQETVDAVRNGFVVIAFEMLPANFASIKAKLQGQKEFKFVQMIPPQGSEKHWSMPELKKPEQNEFGRGFAYIINAGLSDQEGSVQFSLGNGNSLVKGLADGQLRT